MKPAVEAQWSTTLWEEFQNRLQDRLSPVAWQTWIEPLQPSMDDETLSLHAPSDFHRRWVADRYIGAIEQTARAIFGEEMNVTLSAAEEAGTDEGIAVTIDDRGAGSTPDMLPPLTQDYDSQLIPKYTFDNFVVGPSNRFANAAAMAVGDVGSSHYPPLFIYGPAGLGKTHLLHAVGHHRKEIAPDTTVRYVSSEQFFNEFINGIRRKRMDEFKARYRSIDVLLVDDVQFFEGKEQILEEFFHTFNSLYDEAKQMVISSDRHPRNLSSLEDRLRSRFEWGLLTDIQPPDVETRLAILKRNAEFAPKPVPIEVLEYIAGLVSDNIRELEGALTRVTAWSALNRRDIDLDTAERVLQDIVTTDEPVPLGPETIIRTTAQSFSFSVEDVLSSSRRQPLVLCRQVAMYLCRELTDLSLPKIGQHFNRDHTTVLHSVEKVKRILRSDRAVFDRVNQLTQELRKGGGVSTAS